MSNRERAAAVTGAKTAARDETNEPETDVATTPAPAPTAMVVQGGRDLRRDPAAFEPRSFRELANLSDFIHRSGLAPKAFNTPQAIGVAIIMGRELGLTAWRSLRAIHVIEGRPSPSADLTLALCLQRSDVCEWFLLVESNDKLAKYEAKRRGAPRSVTLSYTIGQAQRAGLAAKAVWKAHTEAMLRARCITALARAVFPDLVMGLHDPDELGASVGYDSTPDGGVRLVRDAEFIDDAPAEDPAPAKRTRKAAPAPDPEPADDAPMDAATAAEVIKDLASVQQSDPDAFTAACQVVGVPVAEWNTRLDRLEALRDAVAQELPLG